MRLIFIKEDMVIKDTILYGLTVLLFIALCASIVVFFVFKNKVHKVRKSIALVTYDIEAANEVGDDLYQKLMLVSGNQNLQLLASRYLKTRATVANQVIYIHPNKDAEQNIVRV